MMGKVISISCQEVIVSRDIFSLRSEDTCLLHRRGTLRFTMRNVCPKVHLAHPPFTKGTLQYTVALCSCTQDFLEEKPRGTQQWSAVMPSFDMDYAGQGLLGQSLPQQVRKVLKSSFSKAVQQPPRFSLSATPGSSPFHTLLCCHSGEAFQSASLSVITISPNFHDFPFFFFPLLGIMPFHLNCFQNLQRQSS